MNDECRMTNVECPVAKLSSRKDASSRGDECGGVIHSSFRIRSRKAGTFSRGYILLELVIALTIFSIAVLGLARSLSTALEVANSLNKDNAIRIGLRSFLEEARRKKTTAEMAMTAADDRLGCTYSSVIEEAGLQNSDGRNLADLYKLTATATLPGVTDEQQPEPVTVYVYQPQTSGR
jgi:type II secretory pathway pseudopilin PulG